VPDPLPTFSNFIRDGNVHAYMQACTADWPRLKETSSFWCHEDRVGSRAGDLSVTESRPCTEMAGLIGYKPSDTLAPRGALIVQTTPVAT
jgi:hypothetical protein